MDQDAHKEIDDVLGEAVARLRLRTTPLALAAVTLNDLVGRQIDQGIGTPSTPLEHTVRSAFRTSDFVTHMDPCGVAVVCEDVRHDASRAILDRLNAAVSRAVNGASERGDLRPIIVMTRDPNTDPKTMLAAARTALASRSRDGIWSPVLWIGDQFEATASEVFVSGGATDAVGDPRGEGRPHAYRREMDDTLFSEVIQQASDGMIVVDGEGLVRFANFAAAHLLGYTPTEVVGTRLGIPIAEGGIAEVELWRDPVTPLILELRVVESTWHGQSASFAVIRDVTTRPAAEQRQRPIPSHGELARSVADLESAALFIAHDLEQPVASVDRCLHALSVQPGQADANNILERAREGLGAMRHSIGSLIEYASSGSTELVLEEVDCEKIVSACRMATVGFGGEVRVNSPLPRIVADRRLIRQVFMNLIANGLKHRRPGVDAVVDVSAQPTPAGWTFCVADNGAGVQPAMRRLIFEPFWRGEGAPEGRGLGLAACKRAVARLGGRIWVEDGRGCGSRFCFTVPLAQHRQPHTLT